MIRFSSWGKRFCTPRSSETQHERQVEWDKVLLADEKTHKETHFAMPSGVGFSVEAR